MSTKTSIKRIALVAVAALGLGAVSTVAANAAEVYVSPIALTAPTAPVTGTSFSVTVKGTVSAIASGNVATLKAYWLTKPAGSSSLLTATANATNPTNGTFGIGSIPAVPVQSLTLTAAGGAVAAAKYTFGTIDYTATVAGSYTLRVWNDQDGLGSLSIGEDYADVTFTVAAAPAFSTALSSAYMAAASETNAANFTSTTNAVARSADKALGTGIGQIKVSLRNADASANLSGNTVTAYLASGAGFVSVDNTAGAGTNANTRTASATANGSGLAYVHVFTDGTAGAGSVVVTVTDAVSGATSTLGTWTVTSTGDIASIAVAAKNYTIGKSGGADTGATSSDATHTPAIVVVTKDKGGNEANSGNAVTVVSSDLLVVSGGSCVQDTNDATYGYGAVGYYDCKFTTAATAKSGDKATLTIKTLNPADGVTYLSTTVDVTVGGSVAKETLSLDSSSYAPGDKLVITLKAVDSSGNPVYDGADTATISGANKSIIGLPGAASKYVGGVKTWKTGIYAPATDGDFTITADGADAAGTALSVTATVSGSTSAATDAANEATDAANAATDAANAAAEAADAATAAAQDAQAAVAELASQVAALIAGIKAQITTLTNLVIKIQKKVKA